MHSPLLWYNAVYVCMYVCHVCMHAYQNVHVCTHADRHKRYLSNGSCARVTIMQYVCVCIYVSMHVCMCEYVPFQLKQRTCVHQAVVRFTKCDQAGGTPEPLYVYMYT